MWFCLERRGEGRRSGGKGLRWLLFFLVCVIIPSQACESLSLTFCVCVFLQNYAYGVYLNDSRVVFFFKTYNRTYTVHSNSNSYSDGRWYKVHVVRGLRNTSLAVRPVGPSDSGAVDHVTIMTKTTEYLADGQALLFGGKDPNRSASLHP